MKFVFRKIQCPETKSREALRFEGNIIHCSPVHMFICTTVKSLLANEDDMRMSKHVL